MVLSLLLYAKALRFAVPASALVAVAPHYFACWLSWRILSCVLPRRAYEAVDELMYHTYQAYVTFFFEVYNGSKIIFYGDRLPTEKTENVLYICNHQSAVDWVISDMIAIRQGSLGHLRYVLKNGLRYLPLYGFYFAQHGCIYVKKEDPRNEQRIRRKLKTIEANKTPIWLVIFPEGTRYNTTKPKVIEKSQEFSKENGLEVLDHVLIPRTKATEVSLEEIGTYIDAVYDVTIAYHDPRMPLLPRKEGPSLTEFLADGNQELHIHLDRIEGDSIPKTAPEVKLWLFERFARKDTLLASFYDTSEGGKFPGRPYDVPLPLRQTLVPTLGFVALLFVTCASREGRAMYWKWSLGCSLASVLYMGLF